MFPPTYMWFSSCYHWVQTPETVLCKSRLSGVIMLQIHQRFCAFKLLTLSAFKVSHLRAEADVLWCLRLLLICSQFFFCHDHLSFWLRFFFFILLSFISFFSWLLNESALLQHGDRSRTITPHNIFHGLILDAQFDLLSKWTTSLMLGLSFSSL